MSFSFGLGANPVGLTGTGLSSLGDASGESPLSIGSSLRDNFQATIQQALAKMNAQKEEESSSLSVSSKSTSADSKAAFPILNSFSSLATAAIKNTSKSEVDTLYEVIRELIKKPSMIQKLGLTDTQFESLSLIEKQYNAQNTENESFLSQVTSLFEAKNPLIDPDLSDKLHTQFEAFQTQMSTQKLEVLFAIEKSLSPQQYADLMKEADASIQAAQAAALQEESIVKPEGTSLA